ncbi:hypothetical protein SCLCIDRAFT_12476 [Scleroderma citrinum Foug A]|uniref:Uncharacterized protein n=1 Tax=Scleroderma citrinum Foug A TaxID=1036808 RepID=A0A0C3ERW0_9AGAM|nr:hypothetical protein SCLCIDRAFT_12476 [Scleroderma citrinum Foug A]
MIDNVEDVLLDSLEILGLERVNDPESIRYGDLMLTVAPKANTLLTDHLFSPALLLAEHIERGLIGVTGRSIVELDAGCAPPSLLAATLAESPSLVVVIDYPDEIILGNLRNTVERNRQLYQQPCVVHCEEYEWGTDVSSLLSVPHVDLGTGGYDVVITMFDLLHFHMSHNALLRSLSLLLSNTPSARAYVAAGKYTALHVYQNFWIWGAEDEDDTRVVAGLDTTQLAVRKSMCRWWVGRWNAESHPSNEML